MTALEVTAVAVIMLAGPLLVGWWGYREGFRQGDELGDPTADVRLFPHSEEGSTVRVHLMNPAAHPVVVSIDARVVRRPRLAATARRSTRRRCPLDADGRLVAVDANADAWLSWPAPLPDLGSIMLVDIHVAQYCGRVRRHRLVLDPATGLL